MPVHLTLTTDIKRLDEIVVTGVARGISPHDPPCRADSHQRSQGPLFIVDGVNLSSAPPDITPPDIENVEVVKGAAGASLYGSRARKGVIAITTRSGHGIIFNVQAENGGFDNQRLRAMEIRDTFRCAATYLNAVLDDRLRHASDCAAPPTAQRQIAPTSTTLPSAAFRGAILFPCCNRLARGKPPGIGTHWCSFATT